jgi:poly(A) polymerase
LLLEKALVIEYQPENAPELRTGQVVMKLGRFRSYLSDFFKKRIHSERSLRSLLFLIVILMGNEFTINPKKDLYENFENQFIHFEKYVRKLVLTNEEIKLASLINRNNKMIHSLAMKNDELKGGEVYQFFRKLGPAGILLCFLSLAETMASVIQVFPEKEFNSEMQICRTLMTGYFQKSDEWINPPLLVNGHDLKKIINENDAFFIGDWLEKVRIATAEGTLSNKADAIQYVKKNYLPSSDNK